DEIKHRAPSNATRAPAPCRYRGPLSRSGGGDVSGGFPPGPYWLAKSRARHGRHNKGTWIVVRSPFAQLCGNGLFRICELREDSRHTAEAGARGAAPVTTVGRGNRGRCRVPYIAVLRQPPTRGHAPWFSAWRTCTLSGRHRRA